MRQTIETKNTFIERLKSSYGNYSTAALSDILTLYSENVVFIDPVSTVKGKLALTQYFYKATEGLQECRFEFTGTLTADNTNKNEQSAALFWTMHYRHKKLKKGAPLVLHGCSEIRHTDNAIHYHRDYYDMGEMLYQHIPLLSSVIHFIKAKLAS